MMHKGVDELWTKMDLVAFHARRYARVYRLNKTPLVGWHKPLVAHALYAFWLDLQPYLPAGMNVETLMEMAETKADSDGN